MRPVRTAESNLAYLGPSPDVGDLHCQRIAPGQIASVWWLTPDERRAIADGANIRLDILTEPIPPVALGLTDQQGIGEDDPAALARLERLKSDSAS